MQHRRLTLRTLMAVILAWAAVLAWVRSMGSLSYALVVVSHSHIAWGLCSITAFVVARDYGPVARGPRGRGAVTGSLALTVLAALYLAWAHHRTMYEFVSGLDHSFFYPDPAINALERWFDAGRPVAPGMLKLHGEYPLVGFLLGILVLVVVSLSGFLLGVVSRRRVVAGLEPCGSPEL